MDSPRAGAPGPPQTPPSMNVPVPVSPESTAPPGHSPLPQDYANENETGARGRSSESLSTLSFDFLVKVQQVFGQHSDEWKVINRALLQFKHRAMSKKEAHHIMTQVLNDNDMLGYDLFDIMNHPDADWAPEDWSRHIIPPGSLLTLNPTSPDFLEPSHEPNIPRLPSMFQALGGNSNASLPHSSVNPAILQSPSMPYVARPYHGGQEQLDSFGSAFGGYPGHGALQEQSTPHSQGLRISWTPDSFVPNSPSSRVLLMTDSIPLSQHHLSPSWYHDSTLAPPRDARREMGMLPHAQTYNRNELHSSAAHTAGLYQQYSQRHQRQNGHYMGDWANDNLWQHEHEPNQASHMSPSFHSQASPQRALGQLSSNASPSMIATPAMSVANIPRPFRNELHRSETEYVGDKQNINTHESYDDATANNDGSRARPSGENEAKRSVDQPPEGGFIHAICGRGFYSRSAVKKHHWGPRAGDLTTTRGCWAKNKKPNVAWDAHPSCKTGSTRSSKNIRQSIVTGNDNSVTLSPELNAAETPSTVFGRSTAQRFNDNPAHGLNTLVSAASFAERIDAPKPQDGRNDSVVAQLDAQAAIAERNRRMLPPWSTPTGSGTAITGRSPYIQMQAATAHLGTTFSPSNGIPTAMMSPSQHSEGLTSFEGQTSHAQTVQEDDVEPKMDINVSKKRQRATSKKVRVSTRVKKPPESQSSSLDWKKVQVQK
ncbi:uncharacterized protein CC84DRAFT_58093 [Paraphaeosphaeria sporulosa]|uniref:Uncharacterized protein n=1 Tax=Paraphaeosphaeria sporulosa TaxID=1460663 RepID=A0A177CYV2_9PLEO|nr:uncharacterized protein CC84DRAFT_58093 [Paraphaeosphaeria sporulosa]OAG11869.1 hypothetical protein CC84DRAFT_58093 [Paraphaeosphaeria sporulosa]